MLLESDFPTKYDIQSVEKPNCNMADSVPVAVEGERHGPKLRRSCEACRSSKGRCLPSKSDITCCERQNSPFRRQRIHSFAG
jgi:hypothetical protein